MWALTSQETSLVYWGPVRHRYAHSAGDIHSHVVRMRRPFFLDLIFSFLQTSRLRTFPMLIVPYRAHRALYALCLMGLYSLSSTSPPLIRSSLLILPQDGTGMRPGTARLLLCPWLGLSCRVEAPSPVVFRLHILVLQWKCLVSGL